MAEEVHASDAPADEAGELIHLPGPSFIPVMTALGLTFAVVGVVISWILVGIGVVITVVALGRWIRETRSEISELPLEH